MKCLLKGGTVVSGSGCTKQDVLMEDGIIVKVENDLADADAQVVDVTGKLLFPGFIDGHTHFDLEVSGTVTADDFSTGTKAAITGGTTMIIDFATQNQGETLKEALANWHRKADGKSSCDYGFHMAFSEWNESLGAELDEMMDHGVTSFKMYMTYDNMLNDKEIFKALSRLKEVGGIAGVHCENKELIDALIEAEKARGNLGPDAHPRTRPAQVEAEAINRLLYIAGLVDIPVIVVHLSSKAGYEEILRARTRGQKVYVETCPQYLLKDDSCYQLPGFESAKYAIAPVIKSQEDQDCLWEAVLSGQIDTISTDHCSFTMAQKEAGISDFTKIPCGMPGVETRPVLMYTYGVKKHGMTLEQMCRLLSENPAKLYGVYPRKGVIAPGSDGDIVVWDPEEKWVLTDENQVANTDYQPFAGTAVEGRAQMVYLRGRLAAENGRVVREEEGVFIPRGKPMEG